MSLSAIAVKSPVKIFMLFLSIILLGLISLKRLPTNLFPDIKSPRITAIVTASGLSPEEIERRISEPLERNLVTLKDVSDITSISRADYSVVMVDFDWGTDMDYAMLDVKKAVANIRNIEEVEDVNVLRYDPNALPIMTYAVYGIDDIDELFKLCDKVLKPNLERIEGVASAKINGGLEKEVLINVDESLMLNYGFSGDDISRAIKSVNVNATGGWIEEGNKKYLLKAIGEFKNLDEINLVVVGYKEKVPVYLKDIAKVDIQFKEAKSIVRLNRKRAVGIEIYKEAGANTVHSVKLVEKALEELKKRVPKDVTIELAYDQSKFIKDAINEVKSNAVYGSLLAVAVLLVFLRSIRPTIIISIAIPVSIIATFNLMYFQNISLNIMSLGGLALGAGMLVDNAIVALESIFRQLQEGKSPKESSIIGTSEIGMAIVASTLTTIVVFVPIVYVHGIAGLLFKEQAMTVVYSLSASLVVALLLIPVLCSKYLRLKKKKDKKTNRYLRLLNFVMNHKFTFLFSIVIIFIFSLLLIKKIPQEFIPKSDQRQFVLKLSMPAGSTINATDSVVREIEGKLESFGDTVTKFYSKIGAEEATLSEAGEDIEGPNTAEIQVTLSDKKGITTAGVISNLKPLIDKIPELKVKFIEQQNTISDLLGSKSAPILIEIKGRNIEKLNQYAQMICDNIKGIPYLYNVKTNIQEGNPEINIELDKELATSLGFDPQALANDIKYRITANKTSIFKDTSGDKDITIGLSQIKDKSLTYLQDLKFKSKTEKIFPLSYFAKFEKRIGAREIYRRRQERIARVTSDIKDIKLSKAVDEIKQRIGKMEIPSDYQISFGGEEEERKESFGNLKFALILSVILVYMVMASLFESLIHPFIIMLTLPMGFLGVIFSLYIANQSFNIMSYIGIVMLGGIVVNNAIVLIDCINQIRQEGKDVREAILMGGQRRLRPILMTTLTTILALVPLALGIGKGAELRAPMAITVIGGLTTSTILTLFIIPIVYSINDDIIKFIKRIFSRSKEQKI